MPSRVPALLQPYTKLPPKDSLLLLTSVLGASTSWLLIRFLCGALGGEQLNDRRGEAPTAGGETGIEERSALSLDEKENVAVVFVSWMRDWEFWRMESRRAGGLDLLRLAQQGRFAFVDGLSGAFLPTTGAGESTRSIPSPAQSQPIKHTPLPVRSGPAGSQRGPNTSQLQPSTPTSSTVSPTKSSLLSTPNIYHTTASDLQHIEGVISRAIDSVSPSASQSRKIVLILDQPDLLLATNASSFGENSVDSHKLTSNYVTHESLNAIILSVRSKVHSTIMSLAADSPLSAVTSVSTPIERNHAGLLIGAAHEARLTMSMRLLDTGFAGDVSGVLRVTWGNEGYGTGEEKIKLSDTNETDGKELLYHITADGNVRVFERA